MTAPSAQTAGAANAMKAPRAGSIALAGLGAFVALATLGLLANGTGLAWILGSFGASCVLLFGFPDSPFSQPRNVIGGHILASFVGLVFLHAFGPSWLPMAAAGATAIMLMLATRTVHPPAGSNPVIVFLLQPDWTFLLLPTAAGVVLLYLLARLYGHFVRR